MSSSGKQRGRRSLFLCPSAERALESRASGVSTSHVLNSILIRYDAIINELYPAIERKFDAAEQQALIALYADYATRTGQALWRFDTRSHLQVFCGIYRTALSRGDLHRLTEVQSWKLLEVLERHTSTTEFLALCDWLSLQCINREALSDA